MIIKLYYLFENLQVLLLDGRGHLLGRLAALVAKQVLLGEFFLNLNLKLKIYKIVSMWPFRHAQTKSVYDDQLSALIEFNDHEKTFMHYHLRQDISDQLA